MNKIVIELAAPPALTLVCWLVSRLLAGIRPGGVRPMSWVQFWLLLISAYVMFAVTLWGGSYMARHERADPFSQLVQ